MEYISRRNSRSERQSDVQFSHIHHKPLEHYEKAIPITQVESKQEPRIFTKSKELNRVLGGGIVNGSLVLIGGDPGIGKSTLLLQVSNQLAEKDINVLYISGEESVKQTKLRAERLGVTSENLYVYSETNLHLIEQTIREVKPNFVSNRLYSNNLSPRCNFCSRMLFHR